MFSVLLPAKARQMWSSIEQIFLTVRASCSLAKALFSTARTTVSTPRTATYCNKYTIILLLLLIKTNYCFIKFNYFLFLQLWSLSWLLPARIPLETNDHQERTQSGRYRIVHSFLPKSSINYKNNNNPTKTWWSTKVFTLHEADSTLNHAHSN